nr:unnamed protein product [Digitaria exilis]
MVRVAPTTHSPRAARARCSACFLLGSSRPACAKPPPSGLLQRRCRSLFPPRDAGKQGAAAGRIGAAASCSPVGLYRGPRGGRGGEMQGLGFFLPTAAADEAGTAAALGFGGRRRLAERREEEREKNESDKRRARGRDREEPRAPVLCG